MTRDITDGFRALITADTVKPVLLFEADFEDGTQYLWNGIGTLTVNGQAYQGSGTLLKADLPAETSQVEARGAAFELAGVQPEDIEVALAENYQGRAVRVLMSVFADGATVLDELGDPILDELGDPILDESTGKLFGFLLTPIRLFKGLMDVMTINDDPRSPTITMTAENELARLNKSRERRYTHEDQQIDYPGDKFFEFVPSMQDKQVVWG
jgi:hypothetical protein